MDENTNAAELVRGPKLPWYARFFPSKYCELPEAPAEFKSVVHVRMVTFLDWKDRLRVLISGRLQSEAKIVCENEAGRTMANSQTWVERPFQEKPELKG